MSKQRITKAYIVDENGNDILCDYDSRIAGLEGRVKDLTEQLEMFSEAAEKCALRTEEQRKEISQLKTQVIDLQQTEIKTHESLWARIFGKSGSRITETNVDLDERSKS